MIATFLAWWFGQLAELQPAWLRRSAFGATDSIVISPLGTLSDHGAVAAGLRRNGKEEPLGTFDLGVGGLEELRAARLPVTVRLGRDQVLEKTLVLPLAAQAELA